MPTADGQFIADLIKIISITTVLFVFIFFISFF